MDVNQMEQLKQVEEMKKQLLAKMLSREALERLARVRMVNPQLAGQAELYIVQILQTGNLKTPVTDDKLREILKILSEKREIEIKRI